jgi:hypothetical protein
MRSRIFTPHEREQIRAWLKGGKAEDIAKVKHRILHFKELADDVDLYLSFKKKLEQS